MSDETGATTPEPVHEETAGSSVPENQPQADVHTDPVPQEEPKDAPELPQTNTVEQFEKPQAALDAEKEAAKRADEVFEIQKDTMDRNRTNVPGEAVETIYGSVGDDGKPSGAIVLSYLGGELRFVVTGEPVFRGQDVTAPLRAISQVTGSI